MAAVVEDWVCEIRRLLPEAEVAHTGGTSLPDALTRGDVDLLVRVAPEAFAHAASALSERFRRYRPDIWERGFAAFVVPEETRLPTGIALTAVGGEHDRRFTRSWQRLAARPDLLAEHNELKLRFDGTNDEEGYRAAKSSFFTRLAAEAAS